MKRLIESMTVRKWALALVAALAAGQLTVYIEWALFDLWPLYLWLDKLENLTPLIVIGAEG